MMQSHDSDSSLSEPIFSAAIKENLLRELALLPSEEELASQFTFSDAFLLRMKKLTKKLARKRFSQKLFFAAKRVAVVSLLVISVTFGVLMTVPEVRAAVQQTVIEFFNQFMRFRFTDESASGSLNWTFGYLPAGYEKTEELITPDLVNMVYTNQDGNILQVNYNLTPQGYSVDNENRKYHKVFIHEIEGFLFEDANNKGSNLTWQQDGTNFFLFTDDDSSELIKIAEGLKR